MSCLFELWGTTASTLCKNYSTSKKGKFYRSAILQCTFFAVSLSDLLPPKGNGTCLTQCLKTKPNDLISKSEKSVFAFTYNG